MTPPGETTAAAGAVPRTATPARPGALAAILGCTIGNVFEMFDWVLAGTFAAQLGTAFFPSSDGRMAILKAFVAYAVGFAARPVGAAVFGSYGDRHGRKAALVVTVVIMAVATAGTGLIPSYASIGVWAPVLFVICRILQGISSGGEWGGAVTFLVEYAPEGRRGLFGGVQQASVGIGNLTASAFGAVLGATLLPDQIADWGWRIPFLFGVVLAPIGYLLRRRIQDTPAYARVQARGEILVAPVRTALAQERRGLAIGFMVAAIWLVAYYIFLIYMPTFAQHELHISPAAAFASNTLALAVIMVLSPCFGALSDRVGRRPVLLAGAAGSLLLAWPAFSLLASRHDFSTLLGVQVAAAVVTAMFSGPGPSFLCELFPTRLRFTALSLAYNVSQVIFGGLAPVAATWLISATGNPISPMILVMATAVFATPAIVVMTDRAKMSIR